MHCSEAILWLILASGSLAACQAPGLAPDAGGASDVGLGGADSEAQGAAGSGAMSGCVAEPPSQRPAIVPHSWVPMPCAPATCEAFVAPTPADARPASPWLPCGEGCRELAHDWAPDNHRILSAFGSSDGRQRFVAYMRDLDDSVYVGQGPWEVQVVDLADNRVVYDAISTLGGGACRLDLHAAGGGHALMALLEVVGVAEARRWVWTIPVSGRAPSLAFSGIDARGVSRAAISSELWAVGYSWLTELEWRPLGSAGPMGLVWSTTAGRSALSGVAAYGGALFFETSPGTLWSWTDKQGAGVLLDLGHDGVACGVVTDGAELLWREGRGLDPASGAFQEVALMVAPLTTERGIRASAPGMALDETRWRVAMSLKGSSALRISCCDEETKNAQAEHLQGAPRLGRWQEGRWWAPSAASAAAFACHAASRAPRPKLDECGGARFVRGLAA
jgi:hypothetical protein